jgi:hypothetical protein
MLADVARWSGVPFDLEGDAASTLAALSRVVAVGRRARIAASTEGSIVIDDRWWPVSVRMLAIGLFPFGLVALAYRRHGRLRIAVRPSSDGRTTVWVTGEASRLVSDALWRVLHDLSPLAPPAAGLVESARVRRWRDLRHNIEQRAGAHPWLFSVSFGAVLFVLFSWLSSWVIWTDVASNAVFSVLVVGIAARLLQLWPDNRLINWHSSQLR